MYSLILMRRVTRSTSAGAKPAARIGAKAGEAFDVLVAEDAELARKNQAGTLSTKDRTELDNFMRVGNLIDLIQAKARLSLKNRHSA